MGSLISTTVYDREEPIIIQLKQRIKQVKQLQKEKLQLLIEKLQKEEQKKNNIKKTLEYIKKNTVKCPSCETSIEKIDGCNHMTCICGAEFCWNCHKYYEQCRCWYKQ